MDPTQSYDDTSPYITYNGEWNIQQSSDPFVGRYKNSTFHATTNDADSAVIVFVGTDIQVFGAKRPNHGFLSGSIDGGDKQYTNGTARNPELYQQILFEAHGLGNKTHTVTIANEPFYDTGVGGIWLDIDFFSINGTAVASSPSSSDSSLTSNLPGNSIAYTGSTKFETVAPSGVQQPQVAGSPTAVQLAVSVAPSLSSGQRPLTDKVASSAMALRQTPNLGDNLSWFMGLTLIYTMFSQFRRS